jgi:anti-sigma-K factor RskA
MTNEWKPLRGPSPEQLTAYADGELPGCERAQIEAWLVEHPDVAAEVEGSRRLMRLWEKTAPNPPAPAVWNATLDGITTRLPSSRRQGVLPGPWRSRAIWAASAAVVLVLLGRTLWDQTREAVVPPGETLPFPVANAQDVTILSMDASDTGFLVIGHPPILGKIDLADHGDVVLLDRADPEIRLEDWATPMIVDPQALTDVR